MKKRFPTPEELVMGTIALSDNLASFNIQHAIIDSTALYLHAFAHKIPSFLPNHISVLLPAPREADTATSVAQLYNILRSKYAKSYKIMKHWGPGINEDILQILVPNREERSVAMKKEDVWKVWIDVKVVDYWTRPELKSTYNMAGYDESIVHLPVAAFEPEEIPEEEGDKKTDDDHSAEDERDNEGQNEDDVEDIEAQPETSPERQASGENPPLIQNARREDLENEEGVSLMSFLTPHSLYNWISASVRTSPPPKETLPKRPPLLSRPFPLPKTISPSRILSRFDPFSMTSTPRPPCGYIKVLPVSSLLLILIRTLPLNEPLEPGAGLKKALAKQQELKSRFEDIHTLLTILAFNSQKLHIKGRSDKAALRGLREAWDDGIGILKSGIACPEVLGWQARFEGSKTVLLALASVGVVLWATGSREDFV